MNARVFVLEEARGQLSPSEAALLPEAQNETKAVQPFHATVASPGFAPESFTIIATDSCDAVIQALAILFPDFDTVKPEGLSIKVAAIKSNRVPS